MLLAVAVAVCLPNLSFAAVESTPGSVTLKGNVAALPLPTCDYSLSSAVTMYDIPFDTIKDASEIENLLSSQIAPGQISTNGTIIKNTVSNQLYRSTTLQTNCGYLTKGFTIKAAPVSGACASAGCSYLKLSATPAALDAILSLAVFTFSEAARQTTPSAVWWDFSKTNGTASGSGLTIMNAADTTAGTASRQVEVGFLLVKKNGATWPASIDAGTYLFSSQFELSIVYE